MSKRSADVLVEDIREAIAKIGRFTNGMTHESFIADEKTVDAVVRNLEIIGLRNRVVHDYFGIDLELIWHIIKTDLPVLQKHLSLP